MKCAPAVIVFYALFCTVQTFASSWVDPTFEEMVKRAELITYAKVVIGGTFSARVHPLEVLKGEMPTGDIVVSGFNNPNWPKRGISLETLRTGERYLLFVSKLEIPKSQDELYPPPPTPYGMNRVDLPKSWRKLSIYRVPTPTTGDYHVKDNLIFGGWGWAPRSFQSSSSPIELVFPLVRSLAHQSNDADISAGRRILKLNLTGDLVRQAETGPKQEEACAKLDWLLGAQAAFGDPTAIEPVLASIRLRQDAIRMKAAEALKSLMPTAEVLKAVESLLFASDGEVATFIQAEAVRALLRFDPKGDRAINLIIRALPTSDPRGSGPEGIMDPVRNTEASGRELMVRALTQYGARQAEEALVDILKRKDNSYAVFMALLDHFSIFRSSAARSEIFNRFRELTQNERKDFFRYFIIDGDEETLGHVFELTLQSEKAYDMQDLLRPYALRCPRRDSRLVSAMLQLLQKHRGDEDLVFAIPISLSLMSDKIDGAIAAVDVSTLGGGGAETIKIVSEARKLQNNPPADPVALMNAWLKLLQKDRRVGYSTEYLSRELVCTTRIDMQDQLLKYLENGDYGYRLDPVVQALKAGGNAVTDGTIAPFVCPKMELAPGR